LDTQPARSAVRRAEPSPAQAADERASERASEASRRYGTMCACMQASMHPSMHPPMQASGADAAPARAPPCPAPHLPLEAPQRDIPWPLFFFIVGVRALSDGRTAGRMTRAQACVPPFAYSRLVLRVRWVVVVLVLGRLPWRMDGWMDGCGCTVWSHGCPFFFVLIRLPALPAGRWVSRSRSGFIMWGLIHPSIDV
jgi:hypothetical protein